MAGLPPFFLFKYFGYLIELVLFKFNLEYYTHMARKKNYKVDAHKFHFVIQRLNSLEKSNTRIFQGEIPLSNLLIDHSDYAPPLSTVPNAVRIAILRTAGVVEPPPIDPKRLKVDKKISKLNFSDADYIILGRRLTVIVNLYNPSERITPTEISGCDLVQDCIDLVVEKCNV